MMRKTLIVFKKVDVHKVKIKVWTLGRDYFTIENHQLVFEKEVYVQETLFQHHSSGSHW